MNALTPALLAETTALSTPTEVDAKLIALCETAIANRREELRIAEGTYRLFLRDPEYVRLEKKARPYGARAERAQTRIAKLKATTRAGVLAKFEAVRFDVFAHPDEDATVAGLANDEFARGWSWMQDAVALIQRMPTTDAPTKAWPVSLFPAGQHPRGQDAALLEALSAYPAAIQAYTDACPDEDAPEALAHSAVVNAVDANPPQTWEGLVAKARMATLHKKTWRELSCWGGWEEAWGGEVVEDLIRLLDAESIEAPPDLVGADAKLIEACIAFDALERRYAEASNAHPADDDRDAAREGIVEAMTPLLDVICDTPAVTQAGRDARLRTLRLYEGVETATMLQSGYTNTRLLGAVLRDIDEPASRTDGRDADLIATCAAYPGLQDDFENSHGEEDDPAREAWSAANKQMSGAAPETMAGLIELARAAVRTESDLEDWAQNIVRSLVRLAGPTRGTAR